MEIQELFLNPEQCKELLDLGMTMQDSAFMWIRVHNMLGYQLTPADGKYISRDVLECIPTYTLEEVMDMLRPIRYEGKVYECTVDETRPYVIGYSPVFFEENAQRFISAEGATQLNAAYRLLVEMLKRGLLKEE